MLGAVPPKLKPVLLAGDAPKLKPDSVFGAFSPKLNPPGAGVGAGLLELPPKLNPAVLEVVLFAAPKLNEETAE